MELRYIVRRMRMKQPIKAIKRETGKHRRAIRSVLQIAEREKWLDAERELPSERPYRLRGWMTDQRCRLFALTGHRIRHCHCPVHRQDHCPVHRQARCRSQCRALVSKFDGNPVLAYFNIWMQRNHNAGVSERPQAFSYSPRMVRHRIHSLVSSPRRTPSLALGSFQDPEARNVAVLRLTPSPTRNEEGMSVRGERGCRLPACMRQRMATSLNSGIITGARESSPTRSRHSHLPDRGRRSTVRSGVRSAGSYGVRFTKCHAFPYAYGQVRCADDIPRTLCNLSNLVRPYRQIVVEVPSM